MTVKLTKELVIRAIEAHTKEEGKPPSTHSGLVHHTPELSAAKIHWKHVEIAMQSGSVDDIPVGTTLAKFKKEQGLQTKASGAPERAIENLTAEGIVDSLLLTIVAEKKRIGIGSGKLVAYGPYKDKIQWSGFSGLVDRDMRDKSNIPGIQEATNFGAIHEMILDMLEVKGANLGDGTGRNRGNKISFPKKFDKAQAQVRELVLKKLADPSFELPKKPIVVKKIPIKPIFNKLLIGKPEEICEFVTDPKAEIHAGEGFATVAEIDAAFPAGNVTGLEEFFDAEKLAKGEIKFSCLRDFAIATNNWPANAAKIIEKLEAQRKEMKISGLARDKIADDYEADFEKGPT